MDVWGFDNKRANCQNSWAYLIVSICYPTAVFGLGGSVVERDLTSGAWGPQLTDKHRARKFSRRSPIYSKFLYCTILSSSLI